MDKTTITTEEFNKNMDEAIRSAQFYYNKGVNDTLKGNMIGGLVMLVCVFGFGFGIPLIKDKMTKREKFSNKEKGYVI